MISEYCFHTYKNKDSWPRSETVECQCLINSFFRMFPHLYLTAEWSRPNCLPALRSLWETRVGGGVQIDIFNNLPSWDPVWKLYIWTRHLPSEATDWPRTFPAQWGWWNIALCEILQAIHEWKVMTILSVTGTRYIDSIIKAIGFLSALVGASCLCKKKWLMGNAM